MPDEEPTAARLDDAVERTYAAIADNFPLSFLAPIDAYTDAIVARERARAEAEHAARIRALLQALADAQAVAFGQPGEVTDEQYQRAVEVCSSSPSGGREMSKPRLLDLFCGAGGAGMGYARAGFEVVGVDINPQPHYPFEFHEEDAMSYPLAGFDAIHASPPCQAHTQLSVKHRGHGGIADERTDLIASTRFRLESNGKPWVIENVVGAKKSLHAPVMVCGRAIGGALHRHRFFESSVALTAPHHIPGTDAFGVYGKLDGGLLWKRADGTELRRPKSLEAAGAAMGIDWMTWDELKEAIPPTYAEHIAHQLLSTLGVVAEPTEEAGE